MTKRDLLPFDFRTEEAGGRPGRPACGGDDCRRPRAYRWSRAEGKGRGPRGGSIPHFTLGGDGARRRISGRQRAAGQWWWRRCAVLGRERGNVAGRWAAWRVVPASIYWRAKAVEGPSRARGPRATGGSNGGSVARFGRS
jgi:hypothetical protein